MSISKVIEGNHSPSSPRWALWGNQMTVPANSAFPNTFTMMTGMVVWLEVAGFSVTSIISGRRHERLISVKVCEIISHCHPLGRRLHSSDTCIVRSTFTWKMRVACMLGSTHMNVLKASTMHYVAPKTPFRQVWVFPRRWGEESPPSSLSLSLSPAIHGPGPEAKTFD